MTDEKIVIEDEIRSSFITFCMERLQPSILKTLSDASLNTKLSGRRRYQLINCFQAWMTDQTTDQVKSAIHELNLLPLCFSELQLTGENNEEASDAIIACMVICKDSVKYQALYQCIIKSLFDAKAKFEDFVKSSHEDEVKAYLSVYSVLVLRIFDQILLEPQNEAIKFMLEGVFLRVMYETKREIIVKAVGSLTSIMKKLVIDESTSSAKAGQIANFMNVYEKWFEALIQTGCEHCKLPAVRIA